MGQITHIWWPCGPLGHFTHWPRLAWVLQGIKASGAKGTIILAGPPKVGFGGVEGEANKTDTHRSNLKIFWGGEIAFLPQSALVGTRCAPTSPFYLTISSFLPFLASQSLNMTTFHVPKGRVSKKAQKALKFTKNPKIRKKVPYMGVFCHFMPILRPNNVFYLKFFWGDFYVLGGILTKTSKSIAFDVYRRKCPL